MVQRACHGLNTGLLRESLMVQHVCRGLNAGLLREVTVSNDFFWITQLSK
jgi:hypothetical protein